MAVLEAGKHFLSDKPPFTSRQQLETARRVTADIGPIWAVYYSERLHNEAAVYAGELFASGAVGNVVNVVGLGPHRLSAVVDSDEGRARAFARRHDVRLVFTDMEEALAEGRPEVVHICTPPWLHAEQSIAAMRAGAWVLCEKPPCGSLAELDRIEAVERSTGCYAATVFQWRFGSGMRHVKRRIEAGRLGGPTMIHGIHLVDALLWLLGDWEEICARAPTLARDLETEDVSAAVVRATVEASGLYEVTNAQWRATALPADEPEERSRLEAAWGTIGEEAPATQATQIAELCRDLRAGRPPLTTGREPRRTMEFITGLYKSAFTGTAVTPASITSDDPYYRRLSPAAPPTPATAPPSFGSGSPPDRNRA